MAGKKKKKGKWESRNKVGGKGRKKGKIVFTADCDIMHLARIQGRDRGPPLKINKENRAHSNTGPGPKITKLPSQNSIMDASETTGA